MRVGLNGGPRDGETMDLPGEGYPVVRFPVLTAKACGCPECRGTVWHIYRRVADGSARFEYEGWE